MKKLIAYACLFLSLVFLLGCEEEPPLVSEERPINIELSATDYNPDYMGNSTVAWKVTGNYERVSISLNGEVVSTEPQGEKNISNIISNQIVLISVFGKDQVEPKRETMIIYSKQDTIDILPTIYFPNPNPLPAGGGVVTVIYSTLNATSVEYGGVSYPPIGSFKTCWILSDTTLSLIVKGPGGEIITKISISVTPPTEQELKEMQMAFGGWRENFSRESYNKEGGPWTIRNINYDDPCMIGDVWKFYLTPEQKVTFTDPIPCGGADPYVFTWDWSLNGDTLSGFGDKKIVHISWDKMIWLLEGSESSWNGTEWITVPIWIEETFIHP